MKPKFRILFIILGTVFLCCLLCVVVQTVSVPPYLPVPLEMQGILHGPMTLEQASNIERLAPLYYPDLDANMPYGNLGVRYYYHFTMAEISIFTYFVTKNSENEDVRVARIETYIHKPVPYHVTALDKEVSVNKAVSGLARLCEVPLNESNYDRIVGPPYQSCLSWDNNGINILYSIWPEEEAVDFVNSLNIKAKQ